MRLAFALLFLTIAASATLSPSPSAAPRGAPQRPVTPDEVVANGSVSNTDRSFGSLPEGPLLGEAGGPSPQPAVPYEHDVTYQGIASQAGESHGRNYLAMREPRGTVVRICGAGDCLTLTVNDYGPSARIRPKRVADIAVGHWEAICGLPRRLGLCHVTVTVLSRPHGATPTLPPTDLEETP